MKQQTSATTETKSKCSDIIDFREKTFHVGIDVHQKDYQVAKVHEGICLGSHRMASSAELVIAHLEGYYRGAEYKCVYESCA